MKTMTPGIFLRLSLAMTTLPLLMAGCGGSDSANTGTNDATPSAVNPSQMAVVATTASDYSAGAHAVFSTTSPFGGSDTLLPTVSDISVACHGDYFYRIERYNADNITRFAFDAPSTPLYQYSTMNSDGTDVFSSNPYDLIFARDDKAYLLRYGSNTAWIVNPQATTEAEFKMGELDLSAYAVDAASVASMSSATIADGYLFITLQRQQNYVPREAYVAVFDTLTDTEIDVDNTTDLKGIALPVKNPSDIEYNADTGLVYVVGTGSYFPQEFSGGIATIDPADNFATRLLLDDGDADSHPFGQITHMEIISATVGYISGYADWQDESLYRFNPSSGAVETDANGVPLPVAGIASVSVGGLSQDANNQVWVSFTDNRSIAGIRLLDGISGTITQDLLPTALNPGDIAICAQSAQ